MAEVFFFLPHPSPEHNLKNGKSRVCLSFSQVASVDKDSSSITTTQESSLSVAFFLFLPWATNFKIASLTITINEDHRLL